MGRASVKADKNIYQKTREQLGLTRERAADLLDGLTADRLEKIENDRVKVHPEDVLIMADGYKAPALRNYYCANECPIGKKDVAQVTLKDLPQIVLQLLSSLGTLQAKKDLLIDITIDGQIQDHEIADFVKIQSELEKMSRSVEALQIWAEQMLVDGKINLDIYEQYKRS